MQKGISLTFIALFFVLNIIAQNIPQKMDYTIYHKEINKAESYFCKLPVK
jgi:hypothetical protein